ncbi:MAG: hypothetical protein JWO82_536, partial [Akkermansiaceae bacterium]|nr:hypothetical protein [Akkermansiaceae bacterium]
MKSSLTLFLLLALSFPAFAADLDPAIAPLAATRQTEKDKLVEQNTAAIKFARDAYLVALDLEAKSATDSTAVSAINDEKKMATDGFPGPNPPGGLPRKLQSPRRTFVKAVEKADDDMEKEVRKINADYLAALAKLSDPKLAGPIAEERRRLQGQGPVRDMQKDLPGTTWKSINRGDLLTFGEHLANKSIHFETPNATTLVIHWDGCYSDTLTLDP